MRAVFAALPRPEGLPAPGEKLPPMVLAGQQQSDSGQDSRPSSRVPSASRSRDAGPAEDAQLPPKTADTPLQNPQVSSLRLN